jgi:hypothetical protein
LEVIFFVSGARDYQAMDWYRMLKEACSTKRFVFVTDLVSSEGYEKLIKDDDDIIELYNIDRFLFTNQSKYGNVWRNIVKLLFFPLQAWRLRGISRNNPASIFHAHTMYYMFLCWAAGISYIGRPQASEILIRTKKSRIYKYFAIKSLLAADQIIIDSINMQNKVFQLCGKQSTIIQNWIDIIAISNTINNTCKTENVVSIRGFAPLYRIDEIFDARERSLHNPRLQLIYPFSEDAYKDKVSKKLQVGDLDIGRLSRDKMYELLVSVKLVISIPMSDSSPRSVYESIFCGCCVAVTYNPWIDVLPKCMKARLIIVNLEDDQWLERAIGHANLITKKIYKPSEMALNMFDQRKLMQIIVDRFY